RRRAAPARAGLFLDPAQPVAPCLARHDDPDRGRLRRRTTGAVRGSRRRYRSWLLWKASSPSSRYALSRRASLDRRDADCVIDVPRSAPHSAYRQPTRCRSAARPGATASLPLHLLPGANQQRWILLERLVREDRCLRWLSRRSTGWLGAAVYERRATERGARTPPLSIRRRSGPCAVGSGFFAGHRGALPLESGQRSPH